MTQTVVADFCARLLEHGAQVIDTFFETTLLIVRLIKRGAERHGVTAIPTAVDQRVDGAAHAGYPIITLSGFAFVRCCFGLAQPGFIGQIAANRQSARGPVFTRFLALIK